MTGSNHPLNEELTKMINATRFRYNVQYKYTGDSQRIEQWLDKNCSFSYDFVIDKASTGPSSAGNIQLCFKNEIDWTKFCDMYLVVFKSPALNRLRSLYLQHLAYHLDAVLFE